jgi:hypothetical protein
LAPRAGVLNHPPPGRIPPALGTAFGQAARPGLRRARSAQPVMRGNPVRALPAIVPIIDIANYP